MRHKSGSEEIVRADRKMAGTDEVGLHLGRGEESTVTALPRVKRVGILYVRLGHDKRAKRLITKLNE